MNILSNLFQKIICLWMCVLTDSNRELIAGQAGFGKRTLVTLPATAFDELLKPDLGRYVHIGGFNCCVIWVSIVNRTRFGCLRINRIVKLCLVYYFMQRKKVTSNPIQSQAPLLLFFIHLITLVRIFFFVRHLIQIHLPN